uniref:Transposase n=1 Tax=Candidatus Kentrum sp. LFY TaxID=2126342 RepID=A0A450X802_9GAMM|nr:MAG: conserved hypothetical protein (putative transposase or invertase) [Candidatus Kentron sp. LFY]
MLTQVDIERMPFYRLGKEQGIEQGIERGMEQGKMEGLREGRREVAGALLAKGVTIDVISEASGLSVEEIRKLAAH